MLWHLQCHRHRLLRLVAAARLQYNFKHPDGLPQPTPPTEASDVRYGAKRFPDQSDAGSWPGGAGTDAKQSGEQGEPLLNEPLMTPFGKEDTQNAMGVMK